MHDAYLIDPARPSNHQNLAPLIQTVDRAVTAWCAMLDRRYSTHDNRPVASPTFHVSEEDKLALIRALMPQLFDALQAASGPEGFTADDVIDVFALGMGLIIENDTNLTAPSHFREAAESAKQHIIRRVKDLRDSRGDGGSMLDAILHHRPSQTLN